MKIGSISVIFVVLRFISTIFNKHRVNSSYSQKFIKEKKSLNRIQYTHVFFIFL